MAFSDYFSYSNATRKLTKSKWIHVAVTYTYDAQLKLYLNANLASSYVVDPITVQNRLRNAQFFGMASQPLTAYLDDVMMFNQTLSSGQVLTTMLVYT